MLTHLFRMLVLKLKIMIRCSDDKAGYLSNVIGMKISFLKSPMVATIRHQRKRRFSTNYSTSIAAASASPLISGQVTRDSYGPNFYKDVCNSFFGSLTLWNPTSML